MSKIPHILVIGSRENSSEHVEIMGQLLNLKEDRKATFNLIEAVLSSTLFEITEEIEENIKEADIVIFLLSSELLNLYFKFKSVFGSILENHKQGNVRLYQILLQKCAWEHTDLYEVLTLPNSKVPIYNTNNVSVQEGYNQVLEALEYILKDLAVVYNLAKSKNDLEEETALVTIVSEEEKVLVNRENIDIVNQTLVNDVFPLNGVPTATYVEPTSFKRLISSIRHKGRGVIIEGPSGVGKTTIIKKAINIIETNEPVKYITARDKKTIESIENLQNWHEGIVVIDDFHRLNEETKSFLSDYLKYLADVEMTSKKLIVIGISNTGSKLISFGFDLANRIDVFKLGRVSNEKIEELIEKGEQALNIKFERKSEIIIESNGSLNIAQILCNQAVINMGIEYSKASTQIVSSSGSQVVSIAMDVVREKFKNFIFEFCRLGGNRNYSYIKLLKEIGRSENGTIDLYQMKQLKPDLFSNPIASINGSEIESLIRDSKDAKKFISYDSLTTNIVVDDPQLTFYINNTPEHVLVKDSAKVNSNNRDKLFICYSHKDIEYFERIITHLKPLTNDEVVDIWSDKRIRAGQIWNYEIERALHRTKVAILLISGDFLASDYIGRNELPTLVKACSDEGAVIIPIFLSPAYVNKFENITQYQGINSPSKTLAEMTPAEKERCYAELTKAVEDYFL